MKKFLIIFMLFYSQLLAQTNIIKFDFFYSSECPECYEIKNLFIPYLESKYNIKMKFRIFDIITEPKNFELILKVRDYFNQNKTDVPVIVINNQYLSGFNTVKNELPNIIEDILKNKKKTEFLDLNRIEKKELKIINLTILPVLYAGLLDGINPCAFATIIFLISYLAYLRKTKKIILLTGIFYILGVFSTYFLIGLGFFTAITKLPFYSKIAFFVNLLIAFFTYILAILSLKDFFLAIKGNFKDMSLQLPDSFKLKIHQKIKFYTANRTIIISSLILGFFVSLFELACTGQIYLPTIVYLIKQKKSIALFYLFTYNLMFILPLLFLFAFFYLGVSSEKISKFVQKNVALVKFLTFILFLILGTVILFQTIKIL